ncbi:MAG: hypothetical protein CMF38_08270 [Legionellaceae bacterium]|nr:hypothetical protein [Legionellaceae bacterium]HCA89376.1 hypothetical protein [Legionellales bacterium]
MHQMRGFIIFVIRHFFEDDCSYRASALAFTSLLAIVPLMTVGFAVLSSFPYMNILSYPIQDFIFENFVPTTGKIVQTYLQQFQAQVSSLSIWGVGFLFVTAILLMVTIEKAMNKIWRVEDTRQGSSAFLLYWSILSLSPLFLGLSLAASSYIISMPFFQGHSPSILVKALPFLLSLTGFTFLYVIVPNRPVLILHGLVGGLTAAILFEIAKLSFAYYLSHYNSYQLLYGAFATVPIFFVWVYWVWLITLIGAEVTYALSVHHKRRIGAKLDGFSHVLLWLYELWLRQKSGQQMSLDELINSSKQPFAVDSDQMINRLKDLNLIHLSENGGFLLSRNLTDISLYWLSQNLPYPLPSQKALLNHQATQAYPGMPELLEHHTVLERTLGMSLEQLFSDYLIRKNNKPR